MYERRWHRWAAPVAVCLTTTAGAATLSPDYDEVASLGPGRTSVGQVHEFGGGTFHAAPQRNVSSYGTNGSALAAPSPPNLRGSL